MAVVVPHPERSETYLLRVIAAAFIELQQRVVKYPSESKTELLQVIAGRFSSPEE